MSEKAEILLHLINTVHRLRAPGGCPWDRAQTHQSLRPYLIEEAHEVLDVLDEVPDDRALAGNDDVKERLREELGDLLMQVLIHSELAQESKAFDIFDVARGLDEKLVRRHPHVFGDEKAESADDALKNWEKRKAEEKSVKTSVLDGLPKGLPALQRTARMIEKVTKVGFQWDDMNGPLDKLDEELGELKDELRKWDQAKTEKKDVSPELKTRIEAEIGDVLFSICNVAYLTKVNPEDALRTTMHRFERRFRHVETRLKESGKRPEDSDLKEMDRYWNEAKEIERREKSE